MTKRYLIGLLLLSFPFSATAADRNSYFSFNSGGDPTGSQNYSMDIDQAMSSGSRFLFGAGYNVLSTGTQDYTGGSLFIGYSTDTTEKRSHRFIYEHARLGSNLDTNVVSYTLGSNSDTWSTNATLELGRIGAFAGMPLKRAEIDRVGVKLDLNYLTQGPWQFRLSGAGNNFYGDPSVVPVFLLILRYTSAGLFASNFYNQRVGLEASYNLDHGSVAFGAEQTINKTSRSNSVYISSFAELSKKVSLRAEAGNTLYGAAASGWYGSVGLTYAY